MLFYLICVISSYILYIYIYIYVMLSMYVQGKNKGVCVLKTFKITATEEIRVIST